LNEYKPMVFLPVCQPPTVICMYTQQHPILKQSRVLLCTLFFKQSRDEGDFPSLTVFPIIITRMPLSHGIDDSWIIHCSHIYKGFVELNAMSVSIFRNDIFPKYYTPLSTLTCVCCDHVRTKRAKPPPEFVFRPMQKTSIPISTHSTILFPTAQFHLYKPHPTYHVALFHALVLTKPLPPMPRRFDLHPPALCPAKSTTPRAGRP
jgi:hypothetical protein